MSASLSPNDILIAGTRFETYKQEILIGTQNVEPMTFHDFNKMNEMDKMAEIADNAVFLMRRYDGCYKVSLYQLDGFYVEKYIDLMKLSYKFIRIFDNVNMLKEYLRKIDISGLFPNNSDHKHAK